MEDTSKMNAEKEELLKKLLQEVDQALLLSQQELLKVSELYQLENGIYSLLGELKGAFGDIQKRKIEKAIPQYREIPLAGGYAKHNEVLQKLSPLRVLIEELFEVGTGIKPINIPPIDTSENPSLREAIRDAKLLLEKNGASNAVDRYHTLLHAYLKGQCSKVGISHDPDANINTLLKLLKESHPILLHLQATQPEVIEILRSMGNALDKLSTLRNNKSLAHPKGLLPLNEANFVIDSVNTILRYLTIKLESPKKDDTRAKALREERMRINRMIGM